jgi:hypothetical protein
MPRLFTVVLLLLAFTTFAVAAPGNRRPLQQTTQEYSSYDPRLINPLLAMSTMISQMLPATNSDGTANPTRQDNAVKSAVASLVKNGLVPTPTNSITQTDMQSFALAVTHSQNQYKDVQITTPLLVFIKNIVKSDTDSNGVVNWKGCTATATCVQQDVNDLISIAIDAGQIKLDPGISKAQMQAFAYDLAVAVDVYNRAGY